ncbi:MAG: tetratricopeptide repeat protein [Myxococcales bacterium]|nr:tetratricopeptide repeat protein [Myxococcales bacterium]
MAIDVAAVVRTLAEASTDHRAERLEPAVNAAVRRVQLELPEAVAGAAIGHLLEGLTRAGAAALEGGDPQGVEDAVYAAHPESPLPEQVLRLAWLALLDELAKTGDKPPFGGIGGAEAWAFTARSRPWAFADPAGVVAQAVERFGKGVQVVVLRGPGKSAMLAAVRRALLGAHGALAFVPPVLPAARDTLGKVLEPMIKRSPIEPKLLEALPNLRFGEDRIGLLGRVGDKAPVALLLDDAHIQSRSVILGLPLFCEPAPERNALLVLAGPDDPKDDSALNELLGDAQDRGLLTEIQLPPLDEAFAAQLIQAAGQEGEPVKLLAAAAAAARPADALAAAQAWLAHGDLADPAAQVPAHTGARAALAQAALEGERFHGFALGKLLSLSEDDIEDLLHDDEFELQGSEVGGCDGAVPSARTLWAELPDGLHPVFRFADARTAQALAAELDAETRARAAGALRDALMNQYRADGLWQVADVAWRLDRMSGQPRMVEQLLLGTSDPQRVEAGFRRMLPILTAKAPYRLALARLFGTAMEMGQVAGATGKVQLADQAFQAAAAAGQRLNRPGAAAEALGRLGEVRLALALPGPAQQAFELADKLLGEKGPPRTKARIALLRGEAQILEGDTQAALDGIRGAVASLTEAGDRGHAALGALRIGRLEYELGHIEAACQVLDQAIADADASRDPRPAAATRMARAFVHGEQGELEPAMDLLRQAAAAFQAARMPAHIVEVAAAGLQRRAGQPAEAEQRLRPMADAFKKANAAVQWADAWQEVGRCLLDQGKFTDAGHVLQEVVDIRTRARDRFALVRLHEDLAQAVTGQGDHARAVAELARARRFAEKVGMAGHLGRIDAALAQARGKLDALPEGDPAQVVAEAQAEVDELEARWANPAQPAETASKQVH